jgi:hypothetical protein
MRNTAIAGIRSLWFNDMAVFPLVQLLDPSDLNEVDCNGECLFTGKIQPLVIFLPLFSLTA